MLVQLSQSVLPQVLRNGCVNVQFVKDAEINCGIIFDDVVCAAVELYCIILTGVCPKCYKKSLYVAAQTTAFTVIIQLNESPI